MLVDFTKRLNDLGLEPSLLSGWLCQRQTGLLSASGVLSGEPGNSARRGEPLELTEGSTRSA